MANNANTINITVGNNCFYVEEQMNIADNKH